MTAPALILIAHGSPDPDWRRPLEALAERLRAEPTALRVELCYLTEPEGLLRAARRCLEAGVTHAEVVAALLSPGGRHVKEDIPAAVRQAAEALPEIRLELRPGALGDHPAVIEGLARAALDRG